MGGMEGKRKKNRSRMGNILFWINLGMPMKRAKLTKPMRIMGFLRILRILTMFVAL
jgi:hypothetical protein